MSIMKSRQTFSPAQCRAGRGLLDWSAEDLARRAGLESEAVELFERGEGELSDDERLALGRAFGQADVIAKAEGAAGEGVRFRCPKSPLGAMHDEPGSREFWA